MTEDAVPEENPVSSREQDRRRAKTRREVKASLRRLSFEAVAQGWSVEEIAELRKVSARTVRREIDAELARRRLDVPARYVHFQVARLTKALRLADAALDRGHLAAINPMVRVVAALDRYHGLGPAYARELLFRPAAAALALPQAAAPMEGLATAQGVLAAKAPEVAEATIKIDAGEAQAEQSAFCTGESASQVDNFWRPSL